MTAAVDTYIASNPNSGSNEKSQVVAFCNVVAAAYEEAVPYTNVEDIAIVFNSAQQQIETLQSSSTSVTGSY